MSLGSISGQVRLDVRPAVAAYAALRAQNARTMYAVRGTGDAFIGAGRTMAIGSAAMVYGFGRVVMAAAEFERKMDFFQAVTDTSDAQMKKLSDSTLKLAQDTIYSADEIAEGYIELGKAGVSARQIMEGIGRAMANLGAAGDIPLAESGQIITSTIQQFDLAASDAVNVVDLLAGAANASIADITDIGYSLKYVGGVANAAGLKFEDTATAISLLAKAGIRGSTAGTSLRQMIVSMPGATKPAYEALSELGIITEDGNNKFYDMQGNLKPLSKVFQILQDHTKNLTNKQKLMYLRTIFNNRALSAAAILTREGADGFREMGSAMRKVSAADVAAKRLDNLSGDIEILRGNIETLMIKAGSPFQETLRGWVQDITKLVQAFGELDPATQETIVASVGITGAILGVMAIFSTVIGIIFRFVGAIFRIVFGFKFLFKIVAAVGKVIWWAFTRLTPWGRAVAIVMALVSAFIQLYKRSETFRNFIDGMADSFMNDFVNPLIDGVTSVIDWFSRLPDTLTSVWDTITSAVGGAVSSIVGWFQALPGRVGGAFASLGSRIGSVVSSIVGWFQSLPGRILAFVSPIPGRIASFFAQLPGRIGYIIGFLIGTTIRLFIGLGTRIAAVVASFIARTISFFAQLPGRIAAFVVMMVSRAVSLFQSMRARVIAIAAAVIAGVINFFARLPGRIASFVANMASRAVSLFQSMRANVVNLAGDLVNGVVNFIQNLPSRVASLIQQMVSRARSLFNQAVDAARTMASNIYNGIVNGINALPGAVAGIAGNVVQAFRDQISSAAAAVRDFAAGIWKGFRDGLGIHSPSYIERAMWQITGVVTDETKKLAKRTMDVQKLSKKMAATSFSVGDTSGTNGYARLARDHGANLKRARTLMGASATSPRALAKAGAARKGAPSTRMVSGELDIAPSGRAFIRGVAQDTYDDNDYFDDTVNGMD